MEISSSWHPISYTGEEKYEMLELNRRLESYLNHVKLLEEENQLLWGKSRPCGGTKTLDAKRKSQEEALSLARKELQSAWREKDCVELEVSNLLEEIQELNILRQKEKSAQAEAKRKLEESKKALEDEKRMQIWLREQAAHLEKELSLQVHIHQDDMAALKSSNAFSKPVLMASQHSQTLILQGLGEEYSHRAAQAWREAAGVYQTEMKKLEESLGQTTAHMTLTKQEKKISQRQVQNLVKELGSAKAKRELLEKNMVEQRQRQNQDLQHLQAHVGALEAEKMDIGEQMGELLLESHNLLKMKMSLSLEVATYRALLDSEYLSVNNQSAEGITKSPGIPPGTQALSSCLFSSPLHTTSRSITHKANLMTPIPAWSLTLKTPQETLKRPETTKEEEVILRVEDQKLETSTTISKKHFTAFNHESQNFTGSRDQYGAEVEASSTAFVSASEIAKAVGEPESILTSNVKEDLQEVLKAEPEPVLVCTNETLLAGHPQTPESVSSSHPEEAKCSEDEDEEETEVSTEMAQISYAPVSAWEENETVIPEDRDVVSELELKSEDIAENGTQELRVDVDHAELQLLDENTNKLASILLQGISELSADVCSPVEDDSEILTWADVKEDVIHFVEEESLKSAPEIETESVKGTEDVEEKMEAEQAEWPSTEGLEGHEFIKVQQEENETEQEKKVEQSKEEELANGEEERMIEQEIEENSGEQNAELMMNRYEKGNLVGEKAEAVMNKDQLIKHNNEEEQGQSDDESLNISASWRTDPGEADSYAQENTLADTRPLIHYKSDEETDGNVPISHLGMSEPTDSGQEREKHEGGSDWSHIIAKRFDTMEDLSEEPELGSMDEIVTDGSAQTVLREGTDEESVVENESGGMDSHVKALMDDALVAQSESDQRNNSNEKNQYEEETKVENYHLSTFLVEKQEESYKQLPDCSTSLYNESREINEHQTLLNMQADISEDPVTEYNDNAENWNIESIEINPEGEIEDKKYFDTPLPEPSQEQALEEEPCKVVSKEITDSDVFLFETAITEEQACPKEDDMQSNLSMLTHADLTDEFSLHCHPESQTNTKNSDLEEPDSSEDESSNASQHSQLPSQSEMRTQQLDQDRVNTMDGVSNADPFSTDLLSGVVQEESSEDYNAPQAEELELKEEQQYAVDSSSGGMGENADRLEWENLGHEITSASYSILSTAEGDVELENKKDNMNILRDALKEECQTNAKENDPHSFFSSSINEGIWSATKFEMAATYDPNDQTETEKYAYDHINPNQTMTAGEDWGSLERVPPTNTKPDKGTGTSIAPSIEGEGEEQKMPQAKQVQCRDVKDGDEETVNAEDSTDEGDSWSSGEE